MKAVFIDYSGTITQESGPDIQEVILRCCQNSDLKDPAALIAWWWKRLKEYEIASFQETFLTEDEIVERLLKELEAQYHLRENFSQLHQLFQNFWRYAPIFPDVKDFFEKCPLPLYLVTNNDARYIQVCMDQNGLRPAGIVCGAMARAYKPHRELFLKALEVSGCRPEEALHIGDSLSSDVEGALSAGIRPVLLNRSKKQKALKKTEAFSVVSSLKELLEKGMLS